MILRRLIAILIFGLLFWPCGAQPEPISEVGSNVEETFNKILEIFSPSNLLSIAVILFLLMLTLKLLDWTFEWLALKFNRQRLRILRLQPILRVTLWIITIITLVNTIFDPSPETIWAIMASSALALGFAAQDILKNIFGGVLILFDRPFQIGDRIEIKGQYGEVKRIGLRNTEINTLNDSMVTIPNAVIIDESVSNANSGALDCMVVVDLWLPIGIDVIKARQIAYEATINSKYVNFDRPVIILFEDEFNDRPATKVVVKAYVFDARYERLFAADVTETAKVAFLEHRLYDGFAAPRVKEN